VNIRDSIFADIAQLVTISEDSNVSTNTVNTVNCSDSVVLWAEKWKSDPSLSTSESNKHCLASFIIPSVRQKKALFSKYRFRNSVHWADTYV